jgi:hypothetical protein
MKIKYPKTYHLPWSQGIGNSDKVLKTTEQFEGHSVVVTEKRDGECTTLYKDGTVHARSIDGTNHPWQDAVKAMWRTRCNDLPEGWRVVGENLYARHSVPYDNLRDWIEVFAIFNDRNVALSWDETVEWCELLGLCTVPVLWRGSWNEGQIRYIQYRLNPEKQEGYVVRISERLHADNWHIWVGKFVRKDHIQSDEHWSKTWVPNSKL